MEEDQKVQQNIEGQKPNEINIEQGKMEQKPLASKPILEKEEVIKTKVIKENLSEKIRGMILPLLSLVIMAVVAIFILIPSGTDALDTMDELRETENQLEGYETKLANLKSINSSELTSSLQITTSVIKDSLEVALLAGDVEAMAREDSLETKNVQFSSTAAVSSEVPAFVDVISGPFSYSGEFDDIISFISDLRLKSPTILAIRSVALSREGTVGTEEAQMWTVDLMIDGYTTPRVETVSLSDPIAGKINEELMNEIAERAAYGEFLD